MASDAQVRALMIAHLPSPAVPQVLARLEREGFKLDPSENPACIAWASTAARHSFLMAWFVGPRSQLAGWEGAQGVLGFTEDDGVAWR